MLELAGILLLGVSAQWIAWRIKIPAIFPLIIIGLFVGPFSTLFTDGDKIINPDNIFEGKMLYYFVSLAVGVILFEGGLTLKYKEVKHLAGTIRNLLIVGTIVMLVGGAAAAHYLMGLEWELALLFGALIIVTGPTVISPLIQSVRPNKNISAILRWEGILIDPIGAITAVLTYELFFVAHTHGGMGETALKTFFLTISVGTIFGLASGLIMNQLLVRKLAPGFLTNVLSLGLVIMAFAGADLIQPESGILSVVVMGIFLANVKTPQLEKILNFKEDLTVLLISVLFIILSAKIDIADLKLLGSGAALVFLVAVFLLRPIAVFISSMRSSLNWREKLFVAWIGPKGIVAAAVASLLSLYIADNDNLPERLAAQTPILLPLTFAMILGTVTLNGLTAKVVAKYLGVIRKPSTGILIVGANEIAIVIAKYIKSVGLPVTLLDNSKRNVSTASLAGLNAIEGNIFKDDILDAVVNEDAGTLLALTSSSDINIIACTKLSKLYGAKRVFRLITDSEQKFSILNRPKNVLFGGDADIVKLMDLERKHGAKVHEMELSSEAQLLETLKNEEDDLIPVFIRRGKDQLIAVTATYELGWKEGDILAYIGKAKSPAKKDVSLQNGETE